MIQNKLSSTIKKIKKISVVAIILLIVLISTIYTLSSLLYRQNPIQTINQITSNILDSEKPKDWSINPEQMNLRQIDKKFFRVPFSYNETYIDPRDKNFGTTLKFKQNNSDNPILITIKSLSTKNDQPLSQIASEYVRKEETSIVDRQLPLDLQNDNTNNIFSVAYITKNPIYIHRQNYIIDNGVIILFDVSKNSQKSQSEQELLKELNTVINALTSINTSKQ